MELGWHPCLTIDAPVLPAGQVPSLVDGSGRFHCLGTLLRRLTLRRVNPADIETEFRAQLERFHDLVGYFPTVINTHHHVQVFKPVGIILRRVLAGLAALPYIRQIREPWHMIARVPGARCKRLLLNWLGRRDGRRQKRAGFPGNDWLAGITNPPCVTDPDFLVRWLGRIPGRVVELTCHPGHRDLTLVGRDCTLEDGQLERRVAEYHLLDDVRFDDVCCRTGFSRVTPFELAGYRGRGLIHAA
jgi:predicted glycoside hydrolase/deacetylase ChbG (UPF0249 family)